MKVRLADIADVQTGFPFRSSVKSDPEGTLAVIQMKDIDDSAGLLLEHCTMIKYEGKRYDRHLLKAGDVIIQTRGSKFPAAQIDKPVRGIAALGLMVIRPYDALPAYLKWVLNQSRTRADLRSVAQGTYVPFISREALENIRIPLPSMAMQESIVEVDLLRRREQRLSNELTELKNQLVDAQVWKAAASKDRS